MMQPKAWKRFDWHFCSLLVGLFLALSGSPSTAHVAVNVTRVGFPSLRAGDLVRNGAWVPVTVDLDLVDQTVFDGSLRISQYDQDGDLCVDSVNVHLLADTSPSQRYCLYIPANQRRTRDAFFVELLDTQGQAVQVVSQGELTLRARPSQQPTVVPGDDIIILSLTAGAIGRVRDLVDPESSRQYTRTIRVAHMSPVNLPELWIGLEAIDFIVWDDARPEALTQRQLAALLGWVKHGGTLLVAASRSAGSIALSKPLDDLLPVELGELTTVSNLPDVRYQLVGAPTIEGDEIEQPDDQWVPPSFPSPVPVIRCSLKEDHFAVAFEETIQSHVVSHRPVGRGRIIFSGVTLSDLFSGEGDSIDFFQRLFTFTELEDVDTTPPQPFSLFPHVAAAVSFHSRASLYLFIAGISSIAYVLSATFGLWAFLAKRNWRKHSWSAFAAVAIAASLLSVLLVNALRGFGEKLHQLTIVDAAAGESTASATVFFGLKTSVDREVDVWLPSDSLSADEPIPGDCFLRPIPASHILGGVVSSFADPVEYRLMPASAVIENVRVRATLKQFEGRWSGRLGGRLEADIVLKGQAITDESYITNHLGVDLERCILLQTLIDVNDAGTTRPNGILAYDLGTLPGDGQPIMIADRLNQAGGGPGSGRTVVRPWLSDRQRSWHAEFKGLGSNIGFSDRDAGIALGKEESALMLISTLGEFDPPAAEGVLNFARFTWSRDRLRMLDLRSHLRRDTVVLIGFADSPGPARLFYRTGDERFTMVDPEAGHAKTMYRFHIPVKDAGGRTAEQLDEEEKKRPGKPTR